MLRLCEELSDSRRVLATFGTMRLNGAESVKMLASGRLLIDRPMVLRKAVRTDAKIFTPVQWGWNGMSDTDFALC